MPVTWTVPATSVFPPAISSLSSAPLSRTLCISCNLHKSNVPGGRMLPKPGS